MKLYLNKKDRIIHNQNNLIEKLQTENRFLREELAMCDPEKVSEKVSLAEKSHKCYMELIGELENIRNEYLALISDIKKSGGFSRIGRFI